MDRQKTLIFCGAHPDDETFGIGTTLAQYALSGVRVYYVCATGGELGTVSPACMDGYSSIAELRRAEMKCAANELGLAGVIYLGYRDSGMAGSQGNHDENALAAAPLEEAAGRIVKIIREIKPDVVVTHDAGGGYGHPDHIATHNATVRAFYAAGDAGQYPEAGPPFQPQKLYFVVRPYGYMKFMVRLMPLVGQDPRRFGRNKDIDLTQIIGAVYPVNAVVHFSKEAMQMRDRASACHASQGGGRPRRGPYRVMQIMEKIRKRDLFMREYPPPTHRREHDLFEGVSQGIR